jgi:flagellar hook-associated protein 2
MGTTGTGAVSINVSNNTKAIYDKVKTFVKDYNALVKEMNELYDANSAKGFEPLTDDEKEAMSEDQIDKWESKIKDSLLRRDNTLGSLISTMRTTLSQSVTYENKGYALSSFGIKTANYTEKGLLHISGDEDDSSVSAEENKLMKALTDNPGAVMETLNTLADKLYTSFTNGMKSNSLRSALTFYNDKEIKKQIDDYTEDLSTLEDKLSDIESRYFKQFSAMEKAMSGMNSQSSYLASMLGTNG